MRWPTSHDLGYQAATTSSTGALSSSTTTSSSTVAAADADATAVTPVARSVCRPDPLTHVLGAEVERAKVPEELIRCDPEDTVVGDHRLELGFDLPVFAVQY